MVWQSSRGLVNTTSRNGFPAITAGRLRSEQLKVKLLQRSSILFLYKRSPSTVRKPWEQFLIQLPVQR